MNSVRSALLPGAAAASGCVLLSSQLSRPSSCQEARTSYYGSYCGDRFGGGIGQRVAIDESGKTALPGTGVSRVAFITETHGRLKQWATETNWKEATRIHKAAYFTRTENSVQEAVLERIREHYVASGELLDHRSVQAALFRLEDPRLMQKRMKAKVVKHIPMICHGKIDESREKCIVDFANKRLGGGWLSYGMVQEEKMFIERFDLGALCARSLLEMPGDPVHEPLACPFSMMPDEAWVLRGAPQYAEIPWYRRTPSDGLSRLRLTSPIDDLESAPTIIAIDAIKADFVKYEREHLAMMLVKAYAGFVAASSDPDIGGCSDIATGSWGCGAFYNNERVMFVIQALAADLAGVRLKHHVLGDGFSLSSAFAFLEDCLLKKMTVEDAFEELVSICATDPGWKTKYDPENARRSAKQPPPARL